LDMDTFDDPTHGMQQLTFFHGYYDQYQYQVRVITCAENDMTFLPVLLYGTAAVSEPVGNYPDPVFFTATAMIGMIALSGIGCPRAFLLLLQE